MYHGAPAVERKQGSEWTLSIILMLRNALGVPIKRKMVFREIVNNLR